jgi:hypothetical protein
MRLRTFLPTALAVGFLTVVAGCENEHEIAGPLSSFNSFTILVEVADSGAGASAGGYLVTVSPGDLSERISAGELVRISVPKSDRPYTVELSGVAGNCSVSGQASRSIRVRVRDRWILAERADFSVGCP